MESNFITPDHLTGRRLIGWLAHRVENLQWHRARRIAHWPWWFWRLYFRVWSLAERTRMWGYRVGRFA